MLDAYSPQPCKAGTACVGDSKGNFSKQIDVVNFDPQYSPFIVKYERQTIIPAESLYAFFEEKKMADAWQVAYAQELQACVDYKAPASLSNCNRCLSGQDADSNSRRPSNL